MVKYLVMLVLFVACIAKFSDSKPAYQVLKHKHGYIPVYIRYGDTPLSDINPLLAEAFGEHDIKARNIKEIDTKVLHTNQLDSKAHGEQIIKDLPNSAGIIARR